MKIRNTAEIVKEILEQKPRARDCDFVLYGFVLNKYGYSVSIPFNELANLVKAEELPSMETVGRARRKVMELSIRRCGAIVIRSELTTQRSTLSLQWIKAYEINHSRR